MDVIKDLDELDARLIRLDEAAKESDAALRREFDLFQMDFPPPSATDPDSDEYRREQFAIYERIAGKPYCTANEVSSFDPASAANRPFPYYTEGWEVIGDQCIATGFIIKTLQLPSGASILEFGPGWGNTTIAFARSGYDVTCIEIEQNFVSLIEERARRLSLPIQVIQGDFLDAKKLDKKFDAVLFFECFHHCADHNALLDSLSDLINPGGIVAFAAEPITDDFPLPWGVRSDGQTLWAIRNFGWLELGFSESYFRQSLNRRGWAVDLHCSEASPLARIFVARRHNHEPHPWSATHRDETIVINASDERICTQVGQRVGEVLKVSSTGAGYALYGPYLTLAGGKYQASIAFEEVGPFEGIATMDVCIDGGHVVSSIEHDADSCATGLINCDFEIDVSADNLELRLLVPGGFSASIQRVSFTALD